MQKNTGCPNLECESHKPGFSFSTISQEVNIGPHSNDIVDFIYCSRCNYYLGIRDTYQLKNILDTLNNINDILKDFNQEHKPSVDLKKDKKESDVADTAKSTQNKAKNISLSKDEIKKIVKDEVSIIFKFNKFVEANKNTKG